MCEKWLVLWVGLIFSASWLRASTPVWHCVCVDQPGFCPGPEEVEISSSSKGRKMAAEIMALFWKERVRDAGPGPFQ